MGFSSIHTLNHHQITLFNKKVTIKLHKGDIRINRTPSKIVFEEKIIDADQVSAEIKEVTSSDVDLTMFNF